MEQKDEDIIAMGIVKGGLGLLFSTLVIGGLLLVLGLGAFL